MQRQLQLNDRWQGLWHKSKKATPSLPWPGPLLPFGSWGQLRPVYTGSSALPAWLCDPCTSEQSWQWEQLLSRFLRHDLQALQKKYQTPSKTWVEKNMDMSTGTILNEDGTDSRNARSPKYRPGGTQYKLKFTLSSNRNSPGRWIFLSNYFLRFICNFPYHSRNQHGRSRLASGRIWNARLLSSSGQQQHKGTKCWDWFVGCFFSHNTSA